VAVAATFILAAIAACTGENLFTGPALGGTLLGPTVEITAPAAGATVAPGDSVQVTVNVASANGVSQVTFSGVFGTGTAAFISQVVSLSSQDTTLSRFLKQTGTTTGSAMIIVKASDLLAASAADTVTVTIGS
jgi:uncharacterized protein YfaS (alpha-2-macroglobulin family)